MRRLKKSQGKKKQKKPEEEEPEVKKSEQEQRGCSEPVEVDLLEKLRIPREELDEYYKRVRPEVLELVKRITAEVVNVERSAKRIEEVIARGVELLINYRSIVGAAELDRLDILLLTQPPHEKDREKEKSKLEPIMEGIRVVRLSGLLPTSVVLRQSLRGVLIVHIASFLAEVAAQLWEKRHYPDSGAVSLFAFLFMKLYPYDHDMLRGLQVQAAGCFSLLARKDPRYYSCALICFNEFIEAQPTTWQWYTSRGIVYCEIERYADALRDFFLFIQAVAGSGLEESTELPIAYCIHKTAVLRYSALKLEERLPFLTSDFVNLWKLFSSVHDPLVNDLLAVRLELNSSQSSGIPDSPYKQALKNLSDGFVTQVTPYLLRLVSEGPSIHYPEACLLLALIYARDSGKEVDKYLDNFTDEWSKVQNRCDRERRKLMFMRYVSLSRAIRRYPDEGVPLDMYSKEDYGIHYLQIAIAIIWRLEMLEGDLEERWYRISRNNRMLNTIVYMCQLALRSDPKNINARMLELYSRLEFEVALARGNMSPERLRQFTEQIMALANDPESLLLANWCIFSANLTCGFPEKNVEIHLERELFFPGYSAVFHKRRQFHFEHVKSTKEFNRLWSTIFVNLPLAAREESHHINLMLADFAITAKCYFSCYTHLKLALALWPVHVMHGQVAALIPAIVEIEASSKALDRYDQISQAYSDDESSVERRDENGESDDGAKRQGRPNIGKTWTGVLTKDIPKSEFENLFRRYGGKLLAEEVNAVLAMISQPESGDVAGATAMHSQQPPSDMAETAVVRNPALGDVAGAAEVENVSLKGECGKLAIATGIQSHPVAKEELARRLHLSRNPSLEQLVRSPPPRALKIPRLPPLERMPERSPSKVPRQQSVLETMEAIVEEEEPEEESSCLKPERESGTSDLRKRERSRPRKRVSISPKCTTIEEKSEPESNKSSVDSTLSEAANTARSGSGSPVVQQFVESAGYCSGVQNTNESPECSSEVQKVRKREEDERGVRDCTNGDDKDKSITEEKELWDTVFGRSQSEAEADLTRTDDLREEVEFCKQVFGEKIVEEQSGNKEG